MIPHPKHVGHMGSPFLLIISTPFAIIPAIDALALCCLCRPLRSGNHNGISGLTARLARLVLQLRRRLVAREGVVDIRDVDDRRLRVVVAPEERRALVQPLADERVHGGDDGHLRQSSGERLHVGGQDLAPVREVGARVRRVVVHEDDVHVTVGLDEWPDGVVLQCFAAVDEEEVLLGLVQRGARVREERVRVHGILVAGGERVGGFDDGGKIARQAGGEIRSRGDDFAGFVEEVGGCAQDVAQIVVVDDTRSCGGDAVRERAAEIRGLGEGAELAVPATKLVWVKLHLGSVGAWQALTFKGLDSEAGDDWVGNSSGCEVRKAGDAREGIEDAAVESIKKLIGEEATPGVGQCGRKAGGFFSEDIVGHFGVGNSSEQVLG